MDLFCTVSKILAENLQVEENPRNLSPRRGGSPWNWVTPDGLKKLWGHQTEKKFDGILSHFDRMHEHDGRTEWRDS